MKNLADFMMSPMSSEAPKLSTSYFYALENYTYTDRAGLV